MTIERFVNTTETTLDREDVVKHPTIRPQTFADYPGQDAVKANLETYVAAALQRGQSLDHTLLHGPPGLGKTTLAQIIAKTLGSAFLATSGPSLDRPGDLAGILASLTPKSVLFIDEIHRLPIQVEEVLYSAMEDFVLDLVVGQGATARSMRVPLPAFTLIGATTKLSSLSRPFLSRFGIQERLEFYDDEALCRIITRSAEHMQIPMAIEGARELAKRSRGTPRVANRLLRRVWDFAHMAGKNQIDEEIVAYALQRLGIDSYGLDRTDRDILQVMLDRYGGGPVGIETLGASLGEERSTLEDVYEPYLVHKGYVQRSPRGRVVTPLGKRVLGG